MRNGIIESIEKNGGRIVIVCFVLFFLYGCITFNDYGISSDEEIQRNHSLVIYNDLFLKNQEYVTDTVDTNSLPTIEQYGTNYGVILQLPLVFIEHINGFEMSYQEIYAARHFYSFLWFFISAIFFYRLALILTKRVWYEALLGTMIYILCPRTLADSFYNIKDGLCLALFTISLYYGARVIQKLSVGNIIKFVFFAALCTASRVVGGVVVAACICVLLFKSVKEGTVKRLLKYGSLIGILFFVLFVAITPNAWSDIPGVVLRILKTFSNYTTWNAGVLYMGRWIHALNLPWHYLFVWIGMTVPMVYLLLMFAGIYDGARVCLKGCVKREKNKKKGDYGWIYLFLLLTLTIPFAYVIIVRPVLYNGWRHFYFMYSMIASWAVIGLHFVLRGRKRQVLKFGSLVVLFMTFCYVIIWIFQYHPYEYVYYNPWIKEYAADNFQRDYWYVSETDAFRYILETDDRDEIAVFSYQGFTWYFDREEGNRLIPVTSRELADYVVSDENGFEVEYLFTDKKDIVVDGMVIRSIYERTYNVAKKFTLITEGEQVDYELNGIIWKKIDDPDRNVYIGEITDFVNTEIMAVLLSDSTMLETANLEVDISYDGEEWYALDELRDYSVWENRRMSAKPYFPGIQYIKVSYDKVFTSANDITIMLCDDKENIWGAYAKSNPSVAWLESNIETQSHLTAMVDGNRGTRFTTPHQAEGMYVQIALDQEYLLNQVRLTLEESPWDYPRNLRIFASLDGENWDELEIESEDNETFSFDPVLCWFLRFELGEMEEPVESNWSIYELELYASIIE